MDVGQAGNNRGKFPPLQLISLSIGSVVLLFYFNQLFTTASRRDVAVVSSVASLTIAAGAGAGPAERGAGGAEDGAGEAEDPGSFGEESGVRRGPAGQG